MRKPFTGPLTRPVVAVVAATLALALVGAGYSWWNRGPDSDFARAVAAAPAGSERLSWTDWEGVRRELDSAVDARSSAEELGTFLDDGHHADLTSRSALVLSAAELQDRFGFSPASVDWELFSQSTDGAVVTIGMPEGTDFDAIAGHLEDLGSRDQDPDTGVWDGGPDLLSTISPDLTPELAYVVLDAEEHLVLASDQRSFVETAARAGAGDGEQVDGLESVTEAVGEPLSAAVYTGDYACGALAMAQAQADADDQARLPAELSCAS